MDSTYFIAGIGHEQVKDRGCELKAGKLSRLESDIPPQPWYHLSDLLAEQGRGCASLPWDETFQLIRVLKEGCGLMKLRGVTRAMALVMDRQGPW